MSTKTAKQQDALTELLDLLTQNGKKQEAAELSALFSQFAAMETQYGKVLSELAAVRELDLCQYFGQKKSKDYAAFFSSSSSFCCGVK